MGWAVKQNGIKFLSLYSILFLFFKKKEGYSSFLGDFPIKRYVASLCFAMSSRMLFISLKMSDTTFCNAFGFRVFLSA